MKLSKKMLKELIKEAMEETTAPGGDGESAAVAGPEEKGPEGAIKSIASYLPQINSKEKYTAVLAMILKMDAPMKLQAVKDVSEEHGILLAQVMNKMGLFEEQV